MKKKICFLSLDLKIGGVERQLCYLLKGLNKDKYEITLLLCRKEGEFLKDVPADVKTEGLSISYSSGNAVIIAIKLIFLLLKKTPDILISFHGNLHGISILACSLLRTKIVCCFPGYFYKGRLNYFRSIFLRRADSLVAVSEGVKGSLKKAVPQIADKKIKVIKNIIDYQTIKILAEKNIGHTLFANNDPIVVSLGRLDKGKGFDVLIEAVPYVKTKCNILIIGNGCERRYLEKLCKEKGIMDRVLFTGEQSNPYKYLVRSNLFVLASESEGLPTVILEAMALKIPCICADYLGGTEGVIDHDFNGYVFKRNDEKELAYGIDLLLNDMNKRDQFIQNSYKQLKEEFSMEKYSCSYEQLINSF